MGRPAHHHRSTAAPVIRAWAAGAVIVLAFGAAALGVWLTLALPAWSLAVLPAAIVLGGVALRLQVAADERAAAPVRRGRHRR